ncbi:hypothetical protein GCM10023184_45530 [Flaviaesturariibacter amylovorans]|uniref:Uncharacterized protein n=1 Tax=Flaviaesturariibacter amylovorans TaxID=1084520 RepID=A0ABP8HU36_9BACT
MSDRAGGNKDGKDKKRFLPLRKKGAKVFAKEYRSNVYWSIDKWKRAGLGVYTSPLSLLMETSHAVKPAPLEGNLKSPI